MKLRIFFYPSMDRYVEIMPKALLHMYKHCQNKPWSKEAVGELFSPDPEAKGMIIKASAGPSEKDSRKRYYFNQDHESATQERIRQYQKGLYAVGLWHTHPQKKPFASSQDITTAGFYLDHLEERSYYLLIVVGNKQHKPNISAYSVNTDGYTRLEEW